MITESRINEILKLLNKHGKVLVKDLSNRFNVSEDLIRKDLKKLENNEEVRRVYGGAVLRRDNFFDEGMSSRKKENLEKKHIIAKKAFDLIGENENIFLDVASTNIIIAQYLANSDKNVTVVTNAIDIIEALEEADNVTIIGVGGVYNKKAGGFIGSSTIENIKGYRVDKTFMGCCGINLVDDAVMTVSIEDGNTKKAIIDITKHFYLVMSNEKFKKDGLYRFTTTENIEGIITEAEPDEYIMDLIEERAVTLI